MLRGLTPSVSRTRPFGEMIGGSRRDRILRLDAVHEAWPEDFSAVGERRCQHGHLQRRHVDFALAEANVAPRVVGPVGTQSPVGRKISSHFLPRAQSGKSSGQSCAVARPVRLAQMQPLGQSDDVLESVTQPVADEIGIARVNQRPLKIVLAWRDSVADPLATDIDGAGIIAFADWASLRFPLFRRARLRGRPVRRQV